MDYRVYRFSWKENLICMGLTAGAAGIIAWLFYRSIYGLAVFFFLILPVRKEMKKTLSQKRKQDMLFQFKDMLEAVSAALKAGYSMENAFLEGERDFVRLHGAECMIAAELSGINRQVKMNVPIELLLEDLAARTGIEEICSFSQVFSFAKRSGGDIIKIFQNSTEKIRENAEVQREIGTVMAAKKMEQKIMALVPFGILLYLGIGMPEFLKPLYGSAAGIAVMTVCLLLYLLACKAAEKIADIQV